MGIKFANPAASGGGGGGTVTNVSSANADIGVGSGTTTPILTLNSGAGANQIVKRDGSGNLNATTVTTNANLTGDVTSVGNATTLTNASVIAKVLTGYVSGSGTVASTDNILQAVQKLNGNTNTKVTGSSGSGTPIGVVTPTAAGQLYLDQANGIAYISTGSTSSSWVVQTQYYGMSQQSAINENFDRWIRGITFTNPADSTYTADHWQVGANLTNPPSNVIHSQQTLTSGDIANSYSFYRISSDGAGGAVGAVDQYTIRQRIENGVKSLCGLGKKVTISFYARSSIAGKKAGIGSKQKYGTGGSPTATETLTGTVLTLTTSWAKYSYTISTNTLVGKTIGTNNDDHLQIELFAAWGSTAGTASLNSATTESFGGAGTIDFAQILVNAGDAPAVFQPNSPKNVISDCQRFAIAYTDANTSFPIGNGFALSTTQVRIQVELPQVMRIAPTLTATATDWQVSDGVTATDLTAISVVSGQSSNKTVTLLCTVASGLTQFRPYQLIADGTANRLLIFDSEL